MTNIPRRHPPSVHPSHHPIPFHQCPYSSFPFPFPSSSSLNRPLIPINAFPNKFSPHLPRFAPAFFSPNPTPQILSIGLASTNSLSPVSNNKPLSFSASSERVNL